MVTEGADETSSGGATLRGSFSGETGTISETGFLYGTSSASLGYSVVSSGTASPFTATLSGLSASTTYYYKAYVKEWNESSSSYETRCGEVASFTTSSSSASVSTLAGWLELPAKTGNEDYVGTFYGSGGSTGQYRNYSYNYDYDWYGCLWVAYPLTSSHTSGSVSSSWSYNPDIAESYQVSVTSKSYPSNYNADGYSRGHQIPNADRKSDATMNKQTYYVTNQTPQLQNKFNGSIWSSLEKAVREVAADTDTVYVATGACYQTVGGSETVNTLTAASGITPQTLPIPNYYWKALLKVNRNSDGTVSSASAIGFWFEHKEYDSSDYSSYAVSVDEIEAKTGFDLFANLPDSLESSAESNTSWTTFQNF